MTQKKGDETKNIEIILYALYLVGGTTKKVHTEDVALKCYELSPSRFSWIKYPKYPSLEAVRRPLIDARSEEYGVLVSGRHGKTKENQVTDGWIFTPKGIRWIENNKSRIEATLGSKPKVARTVPDKQIYRWKSSAAFKKFQKDGMCKNVLPYEFTDFLNASLDTPSSILTDRIAKARAIAATEKESQILQFINEAEKYFSKLLK